MEFGGEVEEVHVYCSDQVACISERSRPVRVGGNTACAGLASRPSLISESWAAACTVRSVELVPLPGDGCEGRRAHHEGMLAGTAANNGMNPAAKSVKQLRRDEQKLRAAGYAER